MCRWTVQKKYFYFKGQTHSAVEDFMNASLIGSMLLLMKNCITYLYMNEMGRRIHVNQTSKQSILQALP